MTSTPPVDSSANFGAATIQGSTGTGVSSGGGGSVAYYPATGSPTISSSTPVAPAPSLAPPTQRSAQHTSQVSGQGSPAQVCRGAAGTATIITGLVLQSSTVCLHNSSSARHSCAATMGQRLTMLQCTAGINAKQEPPLQPPNSPTLTSTTTTVEPQSAT